MGLEAEIWAWRLGGGGTEKEKGKEKIPHMCESISHRPLWGRCPKRRDHTLSNERVETGKKLQ